MIPRGHPVPAAVRTPAMESALMAFVLVIALIGLTRLPAGLATHSDFASFYNSGRSLAAGRNPYAHAADEPHNLNAPATLLLVRPLAELSIAQAFVAWTALNFIGLWAMVRTIRGTVPAMNGLVVFALAILGAGAFLALRLGQVTWLLGWLIALAWSADRRQRPITLGLAVGTLVYVKVFLLGLLVYLVFRRAWRALATALGTIGGLILIGLIVAGVDGNLTWLRLMRLQSTMAASELNASWLGLVERLLIQAPAQLHVTPLVNAPVLATFVFALGAIAIVATVVLRFPRDLDGRWSLLLVASLLLSPLGWVYYLPAFVGPLVAQWRTATRASHMVQLAGATVLWAAVPTGALERPFGTFATLTAASAYGWGLLLLFAGLVFSRRQTRG